MVNRDKLFRDGCREVAIEIGAPVSVGDEFNAKYMTFPATDGAISSSSMQPAAINVFDFYRMSTSRNHT